MSDYNKIKEHLISLEDDFEKFYNKGVAAAGTRVRKGMQELKNMAQDVRKNVTEMKSKK